MIKFLNLFTVLIMVLLITGCNSATENPTVKEILDGNPDADIIKVDDLIYLKNTDPDRRPNEGYSKGAKIGEIKKTTKSTSWFRNLYASQLPKGTEVFSTKEVYTGEAPSVILVEVDGELIDYHALVEG